MLLIYRGKARKGRQVRRELLHLLGPDNAEAGLSRGP